MDVVLPRPAARLSPGDRIDRHELLFPLASGGQADVWVARSHGRHGFTRAVVLKLIRGDDALAPTERAMFLDEARIAAAVDHPAVVGAAELGEHEGLLYLVMDRVDGDSLARVVRGTPSGIPLRVLLRIAADVAAGLHAAHELRDKTGHPLDVVHRDVSPQNILIARSGHARLIDFGVATARQRVAPTTRLDTLKGRLRYMAPEQADPIGRGVARVDRRADVFSLGAVIYEVLAGRAPFDAESDAAILRLLLEADAPPAAPIESPPALASVWPRALDPDRERRFPTALALREALEEALETIGPTTTDDVARWAAPYMGELAAAHADAFAKAEATIAARQRAEPDSVTLNVRHAEGPRRRVVAIAAAGVAAVAATAGWLAIRAPSPGERPAPPAAAPAPATIAAPPPVQAAPVLRDEPPHRSARPKAKPVARPKPEVEILDNPYRR